MPATINKFQIVTRQKNVVSSGTPTTLGGHMVAATIAFVASSRTITDSGSGFLAAGFRVGDQITVSGASNAGNNGTFKILTVVAGTITLVVGTVLTDELAGSSITILESGVGYSVDDGTRIVVKAKHTNTGYISIGGSSTDALKTSTSHFKLYMDQSVSLAVDNLQDIWMDASVSNEGVEIIYER